MIKINKYSFFSYSEINDSKILNELDTNSKSKFIHEIKARLLLSKSSEDIIFNNAYLVKLKDNIVGYIFISKEKNKNIYIEYLILKDYRNMGLATDITNELVNYIFENNLNLESIHLSIDPSNINSINVANKLGFICDENSYYQDKLEYILENPNYTSYNNKLF